MENCNYQGKTICTMDLKDVNGFYLEELVLAWKEAAASRKLTCTECQASVYLAAGMIKEPYFAHYDRMECDYGNGHETEELKKGKRLLYSLLKRSFPKGEVAARYRMDNHMYSTLYCKTHKGPDIAVDYRLQNNSLEKYMEREAYYQSRGIMSLYVLGERQNKDQLQLDWYQTLMQKSTGYVILMDVTEELLILKKSFGYRIGKHRKFQLCSRSYPIRDLLLNYDGSMICDFIEACNRLEERIDEEKERYRLEQERIRRMKELDPILLKRCRQMMEEGNGHLVSRKYYEEIMRKQKEEKEI